MTENTKYTLMEVLIDFYDFWDSHKLYTKICFPIVFLAFYLTKTNHNFIVRSKTWWSEQRNTCNLRVLALFWSIFTIFVGYT